MGGGRTWEPTQTPSAPPGFEAVKGGLRGLGGQLRSQLLYPRVGPQGHSWKAPPLGPSFMSLGLGGAKVAGIRLGLPASPLEDLCEGWWKGTSVGQVPRVTFTTRLCEPGQEQVVPDCPHQVSLVSKRVLGP